MIRAVVIKYLTSSAKVLIGEVELDPVNGGWIVVRYPGGRSISTPIDLVKGIYELSEEPQ